MFRTTEEGTEGTDGVKWEVDSAHDERVQKGKIIDIAVQGYGQSKLPSVSLSISG